MMPYYAGDYYAGDGLFSRFSFRKLGRFIGKAAKVVAPVASLIPGIGGVAGGLLGKFGGLLGGAGRTLAAVEGAFSPIRQAMRAGEQVAGLFGRGPRRVAGATPGAVAQRGALMRRYGYRRTRMAYRRRRRY